MTQVDTLRATYPQLGPQQLEARVDGLAYPRAEHLRIGRSQRVGQTAGLVDEIVDVVRQLGQRHVYQTLAVDPLPGAARLGELPPGEGVDERRGQLDAELAN